MSVEFLLYNSAPISNADELNSRKISFHQNILALMMKSAYLTLMTFYHISRDFDDPCVLKNESNQRMLGTYAVCSDVAK